MDTHPTSATCDPASSGSSGTCFQLERLEDGTRHVILERGSDGSPFVINKPVLASLEALFEQLAGEKEVHALFFSSNHPSCFCGGADVEAMAALASQKEAEELVRAGQALFQRLAHLPFPTVALIHGACLGGGLELALACDARTATHEPATRIGFPEVKLGILPAWGGSSRLPRLIGLEAALPLLTGGRLVGARRALALGLVDSLVAREHLLVEGRSLVQRLAQGKLPKGPRRNLKSFLLEGNPVGRKLLQKSARKRIRKATRGRLPAPEAALRVAVEGRPLRLEEALDLERQCVLALLPGQVHKNLLRLYRITRTSHRPGIYASGADAPPIREAAVIGAGVMGSGMAALLLAKGLGVRLIDPDRQALSRAWKVIQRELERRQRRHVLSRGEAARIKTRLRVATKVDHLWQADLVIEAATEKEKLKRAILEQAARTTQETTLLATNTSSCSIARLAAAVSRPERFLGLHFFNPPLRMPLLEIVRGPATADASIARGLAFAASLDKTPVVVKDGPGFLVNRLLMPYFLDACRLAQEGVSIQAVDQALLDFGMPMGPFRLMDEVGLDVVLHAGRQISRGMQGEVMLHPFIEGLASKGHLGVKSGQGFYTHGHGKGRVSGSFTRMAQDFIRPGGEPEASAKVLAERLVGRMVAEARKAIGEGLVLTPDDVDIATVLGLGFPPWRGGLLHDAEVLQEEMPRP